MIKILNASLGNNYYFVTLLPANDRGTAISYWLRGNRENGILISSDKCRDWERYICSFNIAHLNIIDNDMIWSMVVLYK